MASSTIVVPDCEFHFMLTKLTMGFDGPSGHFNNTSLGHKLTSSSQQNDVSLEQMASQIFEPKLMAMFGSWFKDLQRLPLYAENHTCGFWDHRSYSSGSKATTIRSGM